MNNPKQVEHLTSIQQSMLRVAASDVTRLTQHLSDEVLGELYAAVKAERDDRSCFFDDDEYDVAAQHSEVLAAYADCANLGQHPITGAFPVEGDL